MSTITQPPVHTTLSRLVGDGDRRRPDGALFGWASIKGCTTALKLRHAFKLDASHTRLELGLDFVVLEGGGGSLPLHLGTPNPWACLIYQLDTWGDRHKGCLVVNPKGFAFGRRYWLGRQGAWWEVPLDAKLGLAYSGKPHVELAVGSLPLALCVGVAMLAAGQPVGVSHKEVGGLAMHFPLRVGPFKGDHSLQERVEIGASLRRDGRGVRLGIHQLNGMLRLRQD